MDNFSTAEVLFGPLDEGVYWGRRAFGLSGKLGNAYYHLVFPLANLRADAVARTVLEDAERRFPTFPRVQVIASTVCSSATPSSRVCGPIHAFATCSIACGKTSPRSGLAPTNGDCSTSPA
jgi:hypothetical protein